MAVVVPRPDRDHRDPWPEHAQLPLEPGVLGAVMRDLEHLDRHAAAAEPVTSDSASAVSSTSVCAPRREDHGGMPVRVVAGRARVVRPEHPERQASEPERVAARESRRPGRAGERQRRRAALSSAESDGIAGWSTVPTDKPAQHGSRAADVIALRMRQHDRRQRPDAHAAAAARRRGPRAAPGRRAPTRAASPAIRRRPAPRRET